MRGTVGLIAIAIATATGCVGDIGDGDGQGGQDAVGSQAEGPLTSGARRLTRIEYDNTVRDLLGDTTRSGFTKLPEDAHDPFDNDYQTQRASGALVEAVETLAAEAAARAVANPEVRAKIVPCTPTGANDTECLRSFVTSFGRRALRRPLRSDEIDEYVGLSSFSVEKNDFYVGVELVISAMLQDLEFIYRVEVGEPTETPMVARLNDFEVASRLSYLLLGTTPDDELLDLAEAGELSEPSQVAAAAEKLLEDPRARERVETFHALWLGFHQLPHPTELSTALRKESRALIDRVVFDEKADYFDLFREKETFIDDSLAEHYGLDAPSSASGDWVSYGDTGRQGILSHGSVLSVASKFNDTSPTQRGIYVRKRLLCETIAPPPPNVNVDAPPESTNGSNCKADRYESHAVGSCAGCHSRLDPVGFGLERFDNSGRYREHDTDKPECSISGEGTLSGLGEFSGPAELSNLLLDSGELEQCLVLQLHRYAEGRREIESDQPHLDRLAKDFKESGHRFDQLLLDLVSSEWFGYRRQEPASE
ncbi:MAG: DUF1592 domain-containing protein [Polyangiaceae bacterium]|nr:DUF1592 domain-containing protein [Polyangiaceae bacterium]